MLTRKLIDQAMFRACGTRGGQRGGGENATIELRKNKTGKKKKRQKRKTDYTRILDENWEKLG